MRRAGVLFLAAVLAAQLCACGNRVGNEYYTENEHEQQPLPTEAPTEAETTPCVSNRTELRGTVLSFIRSQTEFGCIDVADYDGDIAEDLSEILAYATQEDPIGAYAVDYADAELLGDGAQGTIELSLVFRRSAAEVASIVTVNGTTGATSKIEQALNAYDTALTLRIRNYVEADFEREIREYCLTHLQQTVALPIVSAEIYPDEGTTRILELHFSYPDSRDELQRKLSSVKTILSSAASYVGTGEDERERAALLYRFLTDRFDYTVGQAEPTMPAYDLLCGGVAHSLSFAAVFRAECESTGAECLLVTGTRDGETHYWNLLCLDGVWYHVDLMRAVLSDETELRLLTPNEVSDEGYAWQYDDYPDGSAPLAPQPSENEPDLPPDGEMPTNEPIDNE